MELTERVKMADEKETVEVTAEQQFDAYAIIASDKYRRYRDLLTCLLNEDEMYTEKATLIRF